MSNTVRAALLFLITTLFDFYLFILTIRVILAWVKADIQNPFTIFIIRMTNFIIAPLRKYLKDYRNLEVATLVLILLVEIIKFICISFLTFGFPNIIGLLILTIADFIKIILQIFFYAILLQAIMSWIQPGSPINRVLLQVTAPLLRPVQRFMPPVAGFDLSPIPVLIILQLLILLVVNPLMATGLEIAFG